jgi:enamine deaminase RidA (YjgF/YER057c/UK114 family)
MMRMRALTIGPAHVSGYLNASKEVPPMAHELTPLKTVNPEKKATIVETPAQRLANLGITLPEPAAPIAAYVPTVEVNGLLHISGQLPFDKSEIMVGRIGEDRDLAYGQAAARACGIMLIAQMQAALGSLDRVARIVKLNVFINSEARFTDQPSVANGASNLMIDVFGEDGRHARSAVGVPVLPRGAAVEVDAVVAVRPA